MMDTLVRLHHVLGLEGVVCLIVLAVSVAVAFVANLVAYVAGMLL